MCIELLRVFNIESGQYQQHSLLQFLFDPHLRKSHSSAAASISACHAFFPWPTIVAAIISYLYFPLIRSAAFKKTAARSAKGNVSHADFAFKAESMALVTSDEVAFEYLATAEAWDAGFDWERIEEVLI